MAMQDCGVLIPLDGAAEEEWIELLRRPVESMGQEVEKGGRQRVQAEKRKREEEDGKDVKDFVRWFEAEQHREIRRIAGMVPETGVTGAATVGVGGGVVLAEDFLTTLKKRQYKGGDDGRLVGTVLGRGAEDKTVAVEGGPVQSLREWRPKLEERSANVVVGGKEGGGGAVGEDVAAG